MKRLKQIEESKKRISLAYIRLLQDQSADDITVTQITNQAKVGRNTFYNHFQKKNDIFDFIMQGLLEELRDLLASKSDPSIHDLLLWRFTLLKENPLLAGLQSKGDIKQLLFRFRDSNFALFNIPMQQDIYRIEFIQGGLDYVTSRWIADGMEMSPQVMADTMLRLINQKQ